MAAEVRTDVLSRVVDRSGAMVWPFHGEPYVSASESRQPVVVDPFPGYAHDRRRVADVLAHCEARFSLALPPTVYIFDREPPERTNGWAWADSVWDEKAEAWVPAPGQIVLAGKRIPLHPAMTRYLVSHEYGHHVEWDIAYRRHHAGEQFDPDAIKPEYRELRGLDERDDHATGGTWHKSVVDVFADDFRLLVVQVETEHWPHPTVPRPETVPEVVAWWEREVARVR